MLTRQIQRSFDMISIIRYTPLRSILNIQEKGFITIVPEQHAVLESAALTNQKYLLLTYLHNVQNKVFIVPLASQEVAATSPTLNGHGHGMKGDTHANGTIKSPAKKVQGTIKKLKGWIGLEDAEQIDLPVGCSVSSKTCRRDDLRIFIHCVGFTLAGRVYKYRFYKDESAQQTEPGDEIPIEPKSNRFGELSIWRESFVDGFDPDRWRVEQVWVPNPNDGVKIPMYIVGDKNIPKSRDTFCLLYG